MGNYKTITCVSIIVSVLAILIACYGVGTPIAEWMGIAVGVLSILVVILIGWQIFNYFAFEDKMEKKLNEKEKVLEEKIKQDCRAVEYDTKGTCLYTMGILIQSEQRYTQALDCFLRALVCYNQLPEYYKFEFDKCFDRINEVIPILEQGIEQGLVINVSQIEVYIKNISNLKDDRKIDLLRFFYRSLDR